MRLTIQKHTSSVASGRDSDYPGPMRRGEGLEKPAKGTSLVAAQGAKKGWALEQP
jgi:hypothetical protein